MSIHTATIAWTRGEAVFSDGRYSRVHAIGFDGGETLTGSPSPEVVRPPLSDPKGTDPEELFVAAISSCHMLFFLAFAKKAGFVVDSYADAAEGTLAKDEDGVERMVEVRLRPRIMFSGENVPGAADLDLLHHQAHQACYIGQSVKCPVRVVAP
jgi:organic hydroperoxide reductase OsmC/OhrA